MECRRARIHRRHLRCLNALVGREVAFETRNARPRAQPTRAEAGFDFRDLFLADSWGTEYEEGEWVGHGDTIQMEGSQCTTFLRKRACTRYAY
jgi:hypothetical protein